MGGRGHAAVLNLPPDGVGQGNEGNLCSLDIYWALDSIPNPLDRIFGLVH